MSQIALLLCCERSDMPSCRRFSEAEPLHCQLIKTKSLQVHAIDAWGNQDLTTLIETDEAAIEQMVGIGRKKEAVHAIEPFLCGST